MTYTKRFKSKVRGASSSDIWCMRLYDGVEMSRLIAEEYKRFEDIKQIRKDGSE